MCLIPAGVNSEVFFTKKSAYFSSSKKRSDFWKDPFLISSKKHLAVASTSAVALCASLKGTLNKH